MRARLTALRCLALVVLLVASTFKPTTASADGDPASDYLYGQWAFVPAGTDAAQQLRLDRTVAEARHREFPIKVAVIASPGDLGSVGSLWNQPAAYARFLGTELSLIFHGPLLVVMPSGLGLYRADHSETPPEVHIAPGPTGVVRAAVTAIRELAATAGHRLPATRVDAPEAPRARGPSRAQDLLLGGGVLVIVAAWGLSLRYRPPRISRA